MQSRSVNHLRTVPARPVAHVTFLRDRLFKPDVPKRIDRHIDYFGGEPMRTPMSGAVAAEDGSAWGRAI